MVAVMLENRVAMVDKLSRVLAECSCDDLIVGMPGNGLSSSSLLHVVEKKTLTDVYEERHRGLRQHRKLIANVRHGVVHEHVKRGRMKVVCEGMIRTGLEGGDANSPFRSSTESAQNFDWSQKSHIARVVIREP